jgi:putative transport protein
MEWLVNLFTGSGVAHSVFIVALVIAIGLGLNRIKFGSVSLGVTWILFVGIVAGHFGFLLDPTTAHFVKEFGLILFVFFIGLQVGPSFFSSLKGGGLKLIGLAALVIILGAGVSLAIHYITGEPLPTMVGIMSGAVTNTPGLGAAQQAFQDSASPEMAESLGDSISLGYAVAYPLGVIGIILSMIIIRSMMRITRRVRRSGKK